MKIFEQWQWIGMLLARLSVGLLFTLSGAGKLFVRARREEMQQTLVRARIPAPEANAFVVSFVEFVFGASLTIGFLTPLCCFMLTAVMLGALSTTILPGIKANSAVSWLGKFLYLPEVLYIVILVWLFLSGSGRLSLDQLIWSSAGR
jgi:putative oxidoreductase